MPKKREWPKAVTVGSVVVKVYVVNHSTNATGKAYVVSYRTPSGRKTVKFANSTAAMEEARLQAEKLAAGKVEAAEMTGGSVKSLPPSMSWREESRFWRCCASVKEAHRLAAA